MKYYSTIITPFINGCIEQCKIMPRGVKKGVDSKKFDRCVEKVKDRSGKKVNPYAVCNASMSRKSKSKKKND